MKRTKPYHHGNLREVLLEAALRLVSEVGPAALTLREVARRARVSHNAPYRHFRDKDDLMAAVATEGYRELTQAMRKAVQKQSNALVGLKLAGLAYINFALRRPDHFTVMFDTPSSKPEDRLCFGPPSSKRRHPEATKAAEESFRCLVSLVANCQQERTLPADDTRQLALLTWSMVHGIAKLAITGRLPFSSKAELQKFAEFVIDQSLPAINQEKALPVLAQA